MTRWALLCGFVLLFSVSARAQEEIPKAEVFAGYSYIRGNAGFGIPEFNMHGGSASFSYDPNSWLGIVGDFGGYHTGDIGGVSVDGNIYSYLFGPKIAFRRGRWTPFVQTLFGGAHVSGSAAVMSGVRAGRVRPQGSPGFIVSGSENAFAMAVGGGIDVNATNLIAIRLVQAEYFMTRFGVVNSSDTQNNIRVSVGVVFRF